jgi:uncharacterized metal-binding protein
MENKTLSCTDCKSRACAKGEDGVYPDFCMTKELDEKLILETAQTMADESNIDGRIAHIAAEIEGDCYGKLTRVEETVLFAKRLGAKKVGIASCLGLSNESAAFAKVLKANGIDYTGIICKVGSRDKSEMNLPEDKKVRPGGFEAMCNPLLQAQVLNDEETDLNIIIGLCVGHDSLFIRHSKAPVTTLIVKDRVLAHNPAACLYNMDFYYSRLKKPMGE